MAPVIGTSPGHGDNRVTGTGQPGRASTCIRVYENGANDIVEVPPPDDEFLGQGGTDAGGNFAIMLNRQLAAGDVIYTIDFCADPIRVGPPLLIAVPAAPAPLLSAPMIAVSIGVLGLVGLLAMGRIRQGAAAERGGR